MDATAVVFGGTGFLGRAVVAALAGNGWRVRVAARHPYATTPSDAIEPCTVDIRDENAVEARRG